MGALACLLALVKFWPAFIYPTTVLALLNFRFFSLRHQQVFILLSNTPSFFPYTSTSSCILWEKIFRNPRALSLFAFFFPTSILTSHSHSFLATASIRPLIIDIISVNCINKLPPTPPTPKPQRTSFTIPLS